MLQNKTYKKSFNLIKIFDIPVTNNVCQGLLEESLLVVLVVYVFFLLIQQRLKSMNVNHYLVKTVVLALTGMKNLLATALMTLRESLVK